MDCKASISVYVFADHIRQFPTGWEKQTQKCYLCHQPFSRKFDSERIINAYQSRLEAVVIKVDSPSKIPTENDGCIYNICVYTSRKERVGRKLSGE